MSPDLALHRALLDHLRAHGVLAAKAGPRRLRFVLHRDLDDAAVQRCLQACRGFAPAQASRSPES